MKEMIAVLIFGMLMFIKVLEIGAHASAHPDKPVVAVVLIVSSVCYWAVVVIVFLIDRAVCAIIEMTLLSLHSPSAG